MLVSRSLRTIAAIGLAFASVTCLTGASSASRPWPYDEGPAGPPALMPDGQVARPPRVPAPMSTSPCRRAAYGPKFYAPGAGKTAALTFDDGPGASTPAILKVLARYRVPATFFNLGQNAAAHRQLVRDENRAGYTLGNHTWSHPDLPKLSASDQARQLDRASAEQRLITHTVPCVFRPPYGDYDATTLRLAQSRRMRVWLWSVDTEDWKAEGSGSAYWVDRIIDLAESEGGELTHPVILMHNQPMGNPATVSALPVIIRYFQRHGYHFVPL